MDDMKDFETYLTEEKRASDNTRSSYLRDTGQYLHWLAAESIEPESATQGDVERYLKHLTGSGKSAATVTRSLASLKSFYTYLVGVGRVTVNPARGLAPAKVERKLPQILTSKEVELFLEQPNPADGKGCRDKAMLELLYVGWLCPLSRAGARADDSSVSRRCAGASELYRACAPPDGGPA